MTWTGYPPEPNRRQVHACWLDDQPALWLPAYAAGEGGYVVESQTGGIGIVLPSIAAVDARRYVDMAAEIARLQATEGILRAEISRLRTAMDTARAGLGQALGLPTETALARADVPLSRDIDET